MYPAGWFVRLCILVPQPTPSINQRHSIRSPVIKKLISKLTTESRPGHPEGGEGGQEEGGDGDAQQGTEPQNMAHAP